YDDAPMPYMQRLSWSGLALHAGHARGYPSSHGCIRLPTGFAAALFKEETRGMTVVITGHAPGKEQTLMASRQNARTNSPCCEADRFKGRGDLRVMKYTSGEGDSKAPPEIPCCAPVAGASGQLSSALPEAAGNGEAGDQAHSGAGNHDVKQHADQ